MSSNKLHTFPMISTFKAPGINFTRTIENLHKAECLSAGRRAGEAFFCEAEGIEKFGGQSAGSKKKTSLRDREPRLGPHQPSHAKCVFPNENKSRTGLRQPRRGI